MGAIALSNEKGQDMGDRYNQNLEAEKACLYRENAPLWHQLLSAILLLFFSAVGLFGTFGWLMLMALQWIDVPHNWQISLLSIIHIAFGLWMVWVERGS
ncbi:MAG: hypothetical protein F6K62_10835 [Sphaerospermopsis sp. SIO1G2]|nr:hypothetical protein [Sphaerospermopsis sp. SIO1G2]